MKNKLKNKQLQVDELAIQQGNTAMIRKKILKNDAFERCIDLAIRLMGVESISSKIEGLHEAVAIAGKQVEQYTIEPYMHNNVPSLLVHNAKPGTKHFRTILNCHLDVVPGNADQFDPFIKDGKLYGRGAYDMKAASAVMIRVFDDIAKDVTVPVALLIVSDEEAGGYDGMAKYVENGIRADFVITGECGSNLRLMNKAKGILRLKLIAHGKSSHSAYPWLGENAVLKINDTIYHLLETYPLPKKEAHHTTFNVTNITTKKEDVHTITPDYCEAVIDVRYIPSDEKDLFANIEKSLDKGVRYEILFHSPAVDTDPHGSLVQHLKKTTEAVIQKETVFASAHATSDLRHLVPYNIPGVEFGPIGGAQHHDHEWVDVQSLEDYYNILKRFLLTLPQ